MSRKGTISKGPFDSAEWRRQTLWVEVQYLGLEAYIICSFQISYIFYWGNRYIFFLKAFFNVTKIKLQQFLIQRLILQLPKFRDGVHYLR